MKERSRADWSLKLYGGNMWWKWMEREVVNSEGWRKPAAQLSHPRGSLYKVGSGNISTPTSRKFQMGGKVTEGNANIRGGKLIQNDDCKTKLEVGGNSRKVSKSRRLAW